MVQLGHNRRLNMRNVVLFTVAVLAGAFAVSGNCQTLTAKAVLAPACVAPAQPVREDTFVAIGGVEQWVTIRGESCANPVILFLHGGPGNTLSPYADAIYGPWARDFTLVQWDQPGAGRTFGRNLPADDATLTLDRMAQDGIALAQYLTQRLGKKKIILTGGSWGSILGVHMVKARPDLFYAYVGVSQVVHYRDNLTTSYTRLMSLARAKNDQVSIAALEAIGPPPWVNPRNFGILRRISRPYEAATSTPAPSSWWIPAAEYSTPARLAEYEGGEDFSFLQFVGLKGDGMFSKVDLPALGSDFGIPMFLIHGSQDLVATPEVAQRYFDSIKAPIKEFLIVPEAGHDPNAALVDAHFRILRQRVRPLAQ
jgi:pimeloyl-ACP methyl ester carboxylesterase